MLSLILRIKNESNMGFKISKVFVIFLISLFFLFDMNNKSNNVNANVKNSPV